MQTAITTKTSKNMGVRINFLVFVLMIISVQAGPMMNAVKEEKPEINEKPHVPENKPEPDADRYDQRQNGTENFRVKVDGLVFLLAPADTLLLAGAALEPNFTSLFPDSSNKPMPKPEEEKPISKPKPEKENVPKSSHHHDPIQAGHKSGLRISHLIAPFLNRIRHIHQAEEQHSA